MLSLNCDDLRERVTHINNYCGPGQTRGGRCSEIDATHIQRNDSCSQTPKSPNCTCSPAPSSKNTLESAFKQMEHQTLDKKIITINSIRHKKRPLLE